MQSSGSWVKVEGLGLGLVHGPRRGESNVCRGVVDNEDGSLDGGFGSKFRDRDLSSSVYDPGRVSLASFKGLGLDVKSCCLSLHIHDLKTHTHIYIYI